MSKKIFFDVYDVRGYGSKMQKQVFALSRLAHFCRGSRHFAKFGPTMSEELCANLSQKVQEIAKAPKYRGAIFQIEADEKGLALVDVKVSSLKVYLMIDPDCDKILETRFFTYGGPVFTALADTFCKMIQQKTIDEACAITAVSIEESLRDTPDVRAIPETAPEIAQMQQLIEAVAQAYPEKKGTAILVREKLDRIKYRTQTAEGRAESRPGCTSPYAACCRATAETWKFSTSPKTTGSRYVTRAHVPVAGPPWVERSSTSRTNSRTTCTTT